MQTISRTHVGPVRWLTVAVLSALCLLCLTEPALANKFETISGGVSGSLDIKREWLLNSFLVAGGVSLLAAALAVVVPHRNALFLNFNTWKQSALVLFVIGGLCFGAAALLSMQ